MTHHLQWLLPVIVAAIVLPRRKRRRPLSESRVLRWHLGRRTDGQLMTDATWSMPATKALHPTGHAHWWYWLSYRRRAAIRFGIEAAAAAVLYGLAADFVLTAAMLALAAFAGLAAGVWHLAYKVRYWRHERHYVRPLERSLEARRLAPSVLEITRDGDAVTEVAIEWPPGAELTSEDRSVVIQAVTDRLAIEAPDEAWRLRGRQRSVTLTRSEPPPEYVSWDDVADAVMSAAPDELVFGIGKRGAIVKAKYSESPHLMIPGLSGGGKSNLAAFLALQEMLRGSLIFNLDPKWISHLWMQDLPNVISAHDIPDLHLALCWLGNELLRRTKAAYYSAQGTGRIRASVGSRIIAQAEELNYGMPGLKDHWNEILAQDKKLPKEDRAVLPRKSPAIAGLSALAVAGRASDMHEWLVAQLMTVDSTGVKDSTIRSNAGLKAMARWDPPGWVMAVGKHVPMPPPSTIPGRIQLVTGDGVRETQVPYLHLDDKDDAVAEKAVRWARELAVSGRVAQIPSGPEGVPPQLWPAGVLGRDRLALPPGQGTGTGGTVPSLRTVTLAEAMDAGVFGGRNPEAVRKAVQRAGIDPAVQGRAGVPHKYFLENLLAVARRMRPE